jgi:hypothetical protein
MKDHPPERKEIIQGEDRFPVDYIVFALVTTIITATSGLALSLLADPLSGLFHFTPRADLFKLLIYVLTSISSLLCLSVIFMFIKKRYDDQVLTAKKRLRETHKDLFSKIDQSLAEILKE